MARIEPLSLEEVPEDLHDFVADVETGMGFRANDLFTFARVPGLIEPLSKLVWSVYGSDGLIPLELKKLISIITSAAAGCSYCQSHTMLGAQSEGISEEKIRAIWEYETSPVFTDAERSVLRVAQGAGRAPVDVTDQEFDEMKKYFDDDQICEIVAVIAVFGFTNKWNDTLSTDIEARPLAALKELGPADPKP